VLYVPVNDSDALAEAIARATEKQDLRESIGRNAMKTVTESYTWGHYGHHVAEYLKEAVAGVGNPQ
jgi:glycosyltransferase involved in cell wall biosynthesis